MPKSKLNYLVDLLVEDGYLKTQNIISSFRAVDRADFVLDEHKGEAYVNAPLPIGFGQTISQPLTVAFMLELLQPKAGDKILDIGAGSGWQTALLAHIAGEQRPAEEGEGGEMAVENPPAASVVALERIPELKSFAEKNISKYNFIEKGVVQIVAADGTKGYKKEAPYDKIIAAASAEKEIPEAWKKQLKIGGRIVAPVGANVCVFEKTSKSNFNQKCFFGFSFVPLVEN